MFTLWPLLALVSTLVDDSADTLKVIGSAYGSNLDSITRGKLSIKLTEGTAADASAARRGKIEAPVESQILYHFDGDNKLYDHRYADADVIKGTKVTGPHSITSRYIPVQAATNSKTMLLDIINVPPGETQPTHRAVIHADNGRFEHEILLPINLGFKRRNVYNLELDLETARVSPDTVQVSSVTDGGVLEGQTVWEVVLRTPNRGDRHYWIDAKKGATPVQILDKAANGEPSVQINYDNVILVEDVVWLPKTITYYSFGSHRARKYDFIEVTTKPKDEVSSLSIKFPQAIAVIDTVNSVRYEKSTSFSLVNLGMVARRNTKPIKIQSSSPPPSLPGETDRTVPWRSILLTAAAGMLIVIVMVRVSRARLK